MKPQDKIRVLREEVAKERDLLDSQVWAPTRAVALQYAQNIDRNNTKDN
jgi:hypothetical protein